MLLEDISKVNTFNDVVDSFGEIIKEIKRCSMLDACFKEIQANNIDDKKKHSLKTAGKTRWGSNLLSMKSVYFNKSNLQQLAISTSTKAQKYIKAITKATLLDDVSWEKQSLVVEFLRPVLDWITILETNHTTLSKVYVGYKNIQHHINDYINKNSQTFQDSEKKVILKALNKPKKMMITTIHLAACLFEPKMKDDDLDQEEKNLAMNHILKWGKIRLNISEKNLIKE